MSIIIVPTPGTPDGPCRGSCDHPRCHMLRDIAQGRCAHCGGILGFGTKITGDPSMHLRCAQAHHPMTEPIAAAHHSGSHHNAKP